MPRDMMAWRSVEWRHPVVGSPAFITDPNDRFDPGVAFLCDVIVLRGEVRGPNAREEYEARVTDGDQTASVVIAGITLVQMTAPSVPLDVDHRVLFLAASVLRAPRAARRETLQQLQDSARVLLPLLNEALHGKR